MLLTLLILLLTLGGGGPKSPICVPSGVRTPSKTLVSFPLALTCSGQSPDEGDTLPKSVWSSASQQDLLLSGCTGWGTRRPPPGYGASNHSRPKGDLRDKTSIPGVGGLSTEPHCKGDTANSTCVRPCSLAVQDPGGDAGGALHSNLPHCSWHCFL